MLEQRLLNNLPTPNLKQWINLLNSEFAARRYLLSTCTDTLNNAYQTALSLNALSMLLPEAMHGTNLDERLQYHCYKHMAMASGTLAFLCAQHIAGMGIINSGNNEALKDTYLKQNICKTTIGISIAHLRQSTHPPVTAKQDGDSYIVNGVLPYVTGYKIFATLVVGFVCNEQEIFAAIPFRETSSFTILKTLNLLTAQSTNTVACKLDNYVIDNSMIIGKNPLGTFSARQDKKLSSTLSFTFGFAAATLNLIAGSKYYTIPAVINVYNLLKQNLAQLENDLLNRSPEESLIKLRIKAINLLNQIFSFAEQIIKGSGTMNDHPLAIIRKEAMIVNATASTVNTLTSHCELLTTQLK